MAWIRRRCSKCKRTLAAQARVCSCGGSPAFKAAYRDPGGVERSKVFGRKIDGERWLLGQESAKLRGDWIDPAAGRLSLAAFVQEWLGSVVHLRPSTRHRYEALLRAHLLPALGRRSLASLRPLDVAALLSGMLQRGSSPTTARHAYTLLSGILKVAQRDGRIAKNPAAGVAPPTRSHHEQRYISAAEVWRLSEAIDPRYRVLTLSGAYAALRWSELAGLKVSRLRLLERRIDVVETLVEIGTRLVAGPPKTGARTVSIPAPLADEMALHLAAFPPRSGGLVFTAPGGQPLRHGNFYRRVWKPALVAAGLDPSLRIHDLRHTAVALAIATGAHPKAIQELCGHASITTTLNVYGHLFEGLQDQLADRLGATMTASRAAPVRPRSPAAIYSLPPLEARQGP